MSWTGLFWTRVWSHHVWSEGLERFPGQRHTDLWNPASTQSPGRGEKMLYSIKGCIQSIFKHNLAQLPSLLWPMAPYGFCPGRAHDPQHSSFWRLNWVLLFWIPGQTQWSDTMRNFLCWGETGIILTDQRLSLLLQLLNTWNINQPQAGSGNDTPKEQNKWLKEVRTKLLINPKSKMTLPGGREEAELSLNCGGLSKRGCQSGHKDFGRDRENIRLALLEQTKLQILQLWSQMPLVSFNQVP